MEHMDVSEMSRKKSSIAPEVQAHEQRFPLTYCVIRATRISLRGTTHQYSYMFHSNSLDMTLDSRSLTL
jgi:hypothetical protein